MKIYIPLMSILLALLAGCAGPNPNIGERSTDMAWMGGNFRAAFDTVKPHAEAGEPWAQLRIGMFYENGWGITSDIQKAIEWYEKTAAQKAEGDWAEGKMIGAIGRTGYFNQNSDARIAQRNLADIFLNGKRVEKDLVRAYLNIRPVVEETKGYALFFCCEFAGGRSFSAQELSKLYQDVLSQMTLEQNAEAEKVFLQKKAQK